MRELMEQFLDVFRLGNNAEVEHFINTVRSGASLDDIRATVFQLMAQNPNLRRPPPHNNELGFDDRNNFFDPR